MKALKSLPPSALAPPGLHVAWLGAAPVPGQSATPRNARCFHSQHSAVHRKYSAESSQRACPQSLTMSRAKSVFSAHFFLSPSSGCALCLAYVWCMGTRGRWRGKRPLTASTETIARRTGPETGAYGTGGGPETYASLMRMLQLFRTRKHPIPLQSAAEITASSLRSELGVADIVLRGWPALFARLCRYCTETYL